MKRQCIRWDRPMWLIRMEDCAAFFFRKTSKLAFLNYSKLVETLIERKGRLNAA